MKAFTMLFSALILLASCDKEETTGCYEPGDTDKSSYVFKSGVACGWCAADDTIRVNNFEASAKGVSGCDSVDFYNLETDQSYFQNVMAQFELQDFLAINLSSCEICVDGCDYWISMENEDIKHVIRYSHKDSAAIAPILPLIKEMQATGKALGYQRF